MKKSAENFEIKISKEELAALPVEKFSGEIVVVDDARKAEEIIEDLNRADIVGFDTETKPAFHKGQVNKVALVQLSAGMKSFLIRLPKIGLPPAIKAFLEDSSRLKVGLSLKDDFHNLAKLGDFKPAGFIDLQDYVKKFNITDCALTKIHSIIFGKRISKSQQLSNWEAPTLTPKQKEYAALDAVACVNIYRHLESGAFDPLSSPYRKAICQEEK